MGIYPVVTDRLSCVFCRLLKIFVGESFVVGMIIAYHNAQKSCIRFKCCFGLESLFNIGKMLQVYVSQSTVVVQKNRRVCLALFADEFSEDP